MNKNLKTERQVSAGRLRFFNPTFSFLQIFSLHFTTSSRRNKFSPRKFEDLQNTFWMKII